MTALDVSPTSLFRKNTTKVFHADQDFLLVGTAFQVSVWRYLQRVPKGECITYGEIAKNIGKAKAAQAVGTAVGKNPIGFYVPCHRVIPKTGGLGNYRWGPDLKAALLRMENL